MAQIVVEQANITTYPADVIVNAANSSLLGGGGVDGAIHRAAGKKLYFACLQLHGCKTGQAKITNAFKMKSAKKIVHTVGPVYKGLSQGQANELLASCYTNSLDLASEYQSVAFPAISTGIYGFPLEEATNTAVKAIKGWLTSHPEASLQKITLIAFTESEAKVMSAVVAAGTSS